MPRRRIITITSLEWNDRAACKGQLDLFFEPAGERAAERHRREGAARALCRSCPVIEPCRSAARTNRECGFWGGETEEERARAGYPPRSITRRAVQRAAQGLEPDERQAS